jgi:4-hydroxy-tetrahydrodipicolinate reductase
MVRIAIHGAAGRMGQRLVALGSAESDLHIVAALEAPDHPRLGEDAGLLAGCGALGVALRSQLPDEVDVVIDFSVPAATERIVEECRRRRLRLVVATTGLDARQQAAVRATSAEVAVLWAPNMSLAVNLAMKLAAQAASALRDHGGGTDVEIIERHHRFKEDAPSGTALRFGEIIAAIMGLQRAQHGRHGAVGARRRDEIGYHAVRVGDNPGEHQIIFGLLGETLEISVKASSRDCYAHGALAAARFLHDKPPGLYTMNDVLGL